MIHDFCCHNSLSTATMSQKSQYSDHVTKVSVQRPCHKSLSTATMSQKSQYSDHVTKVSVQRPCHKSVSTATMSQKCQYSDHVTKVSVQRPCTRDEWQAGIISLQLPGERQTDVRIRSCHSVRAMTCGIAYPLQQQIHAQHCHALRYVRYCCMDKLKLNLTRLAAFSSKFSLFSLFITGLAAAASAGAGLAASASFEGSTIVTDFFSSAASGLLGLSPGLGDGVRLGLRPGSSGFFPTA